MNSINKTLYIPLFGKAFVSQKGLFLADPKAEEIWAAESFALKGKSKSKWLAYYMGIRAAVFDDWLRQQMAKPRDAVIIHIGCGMDSRVLRVGTPSHPWYDVDFPEVIEERKRYYEESATYHMIAGDARESRWLEAIPERQNAIVVMEGVSMYLTHPELQSLLSRLCRHFEHLSLLMDCYTSLAARISRYKNPINDVGVTQVYGLDDPLLMQNPPLSFAAEHDMTPPKFIGQLNGMEKQIFSKLYAGDFARKLYRLFEYNKA